MIGEFCQPADSPLAMTRNVTDSWPTRVAPAAVARELSIDILRTIGHLIKPEKLEQMLIVSSNNNSISVYTRTYTFQHHITLKWWST